MIEGIHIRCANKRSEDGKYVIYELWDGDAFISAAYGPASVSVLNLAADQLDNNLPMSTNFKWFAFGDFKGDKS